MRIINTLIVFLLCITISFAGKDKTIMEKIEEATNIPVYVLKGHISVKQPEASPAVAMYPEELEASKTKFKPLELPEDYNPVGQLIVDELNKKFNTDKFVLGDIDAVPKKTITVFGKEDEVEDWKQLETKFIVMCTPSGRYYGSGYSRAEEVLKVETYLEASALVQFCDIIEKEQPLKFLNPMGVTIFVKGDKFFQEGIYTEWEKFTDAVAPNSLAGSLQEAVPGSLDKFYEKQKKKYDKAMKKKNK